MTCLAEQRKPHASSKAPLSLFTHTHHPPWRAPALIPSDKTSSIGWPLQSGRYTQIALKTALLSEPPEHPGPHLRHQRLQSRLNHHEGWCVGVWMGGGGEGVLKSFAYLGDIALLPESQKHRTGAQGGERRCSPLRVLLLPRCLPCTGQAPDRWRSIQPGSPS